MWRSRRTANVVQLCDANEGVWSKVRTSDIAAASMIGNSGYPRLPGGHHGLSREQVHDDQAERIHAAMLETVSSVGYTATVVEDVVRAAGVSRRTFYELYPNKEACLEATFDRLLREWRRDCATAFEAAGGHRARDRGLTLRAALLALFEQVRVDPRGARLLFVEGLAAGAKTRERAALEMNALAGALAGRTQPSGTSPAELVSLVLVGGVMEVVANRCLNGRVEQLLGLVEPLADWLGRYPAAQPPPVLARARSALTETQEPDLWQNRSISAWREPRPPTPRRSHRDARTRIIEAIPLAADERNYQPLSVNEIVRRAEVSQHTFREYFATAEEAMSAAMMAAAEEVLAYCVSYMQATKDWPTSIVAGILALSRYCSAHPAKAQFSFYYGVSAPGRKIRRMELDLWGAALVPGFRASEWAVHQIVSEAIGGGIYNAGLHCCVAGHIGRLNTFGPDLAYAVLVPFLGATEAGRAIQRYLKSQ